MKKTIALGGLMVLVLGCLLATAPGRADSQDDSSSVSPFKGALILTSSKTDRKIGVVMEDPKIQRLGNSYFLVGTSAAYGRPSEWVKDKVVWVPVDDLLAVSEFANLDEYKSMLDQAK
ncbi:MAG TPA: hypothetical protein VG125_09460 [Pirellulales bacterium]|nr:hypothetical protein [Pirellulales bacterium]